MDCGQQWLLQINQHCDSNRTVSQSTIGNQGVQNTILGMQVQYPGVNERTRFERNIRNK